ncbi:unnamed protein product, partial [Tilletia controversa]
MTQSRLSTEGSFHIAEPHYLAGCIRDGSGAASQPIDASIEDKTVPEALAELEVNWLKQHAEAAATKERETREQAVFQRSEAGKSALRAVLPATAYSHSACCQLRKHSSPPSSQLATKQTSKLLIPIQPNPKPYTPQPPLANIPSALPDLQMYVTSNPDPN